ncbi:MAG: DUF4920 domain-containing protein [Myxococcota bacterium]
MRSVFLLMVWLLALGGGCGSEEAVAPEGTGASANPEAAEAPASSEEASNEEASNEEASNEEAGEEAEGPAPLRVADDGSRVFGSELDDTVALTSLEDLLASPDEYHGEVVKTEGEIAAVCQTMGCWMELRPDAEGPAVRVPMAGHSFFLPRDVSGKTATVQGTVEVRELDQATQEHLESEGALAAAQTLGINATSVVVR